MSDTTKPSVCGDAAPLLDVMARLRDPDRGCPWDLEQTFESIAPCTIEEAYEVVDAIERRDTSALCDELGDLLLQVAYHAQLAAEQQLFDFDDVVAAITDKMIRRHPHIFAGQYSAAESGDASGVSGVEQQHANWEQIKEQERANRRGGSEASALDDVAMNLPALTRANKIQKRAARSGFDWAEIAPVFKKLQEETDELQAAIASQDEAAISDEMGDLLFTAVNLARHMRVDPETALRASTSVFEQRFRYVERTVAKSGQQMSQMSEQQLDAMWLQAKKQLSE